MADSFLRALRRSLTGGNPLYTLPAGIGFGAQGAVLSGPVQVLGPAATVTPDATKGAYCQVTFTANTVVAVQIPSGIPAGYLWRFAITIINTSGGALTNTTFVAAYKQATITYPADTKQRAYEFISDGTTAWELFQTAADIAN